MSLRDPLQSHALPTNADSLHLQWWPRPLGICQWTLSGAPHHPIFIDVTRRVINATRYVEEQANGRLLDELRAAEERLASAEGESEEVLQRVREEAERLRHMVDTEQGILPV